MWYLAIFTKNMNMNNHVLGKNTKNIYEYVLPKKIMKGKENFILIILFDLVLKIIGLEFCFNFFFLDMAFKMLMWHYLNVN